MSWNKPPLAVMVLAFLYIVIGVVGFVHHFPELLARQQDSFAIEFTEFAAIVCGAFMLLGHNWARWLAVCWIAFHVILSVLNAFHGFVVHLLFCIGITLLLFRADSARFFRGPRIEPTEGA